MLRFPDLYKFQDVVSKSITAENPKGEKGGLKREKGVPCLKNIEPQKIITLADIKGNGIIRHIWLTFPNRSPINLRSYIVRIYWDNSNYPSVISPIGDFFGLAHGRTGHYFTPYMGVSEGKGFNCFFPMPFSEHCRITFENDSPESIIQLYYQISYSLGDKITSDMGRFHAHFRRETPPVGSNFLILETQDSQGVYVGLTIGCLPLNPGRWREGGIRFFIDDEKKFATIGSAGWSDWFLSAWGLGIHQSCYSGSTYQVLHPKWKNKYLCSSFRFHILDPIYFKKYIRIEFEQIGYPTLAGKKGFIRRSDDWSSTVYWYQKLTRKALPNIPERKKRIERISKQEWEKEAFDRMCSGKDKHNDPN